MTKSSVFSAIPLSSLPPGSSLDDLTTPVSVVPKLPLTRAAILHHLRHLIVAERNYVDNDPEQAMGPWSAEAALEMVGQGTDEGVRVDVEVVVVEDPTNDGCDETASSVLAGVIKTTTDYGTGKCMLTVMADPARDVLMYQQLTEFAVRSTKSSLEESVTAGKFDAKLSVWLDVSMDARIKWWEDIAEMNGLTAVRTFKVLRKDLDPLTGPSPSGDDCSALESTDSELSRLGLKLRPYESSRDAIAVHACQQEAFRDHYGHIKDEPFDAWLKDVEGPGQGYDPSLFTIAWADSVPPPVEVDALLHASARDRQPIVAGGVLAYDRDYTVPGKAFLYLVFVRRAFRNRGVGTALLLSTFAKLRSRGYTHVVLAVDSNSKTRAGEMYAKVGMYTVRERKVWRVIVRKGESGPPE
ncbi:hypothetical protein HDU93_000407 [Gonapodya sp. JEL0774]|nr:hypothetical protein HDU93_000407 [Gonapodya sp. JEL0774]